MSINPMMSSILCLGDSITEMGWQQGGFVQRLADSYNRRLDVVNRGFGGYNTDWLLPIAEKTIYDTVVKGASKIAYVTIWMGTNDAVLEGEASRQHVPIDRFKKNLVAMYSLYPSSIPTIFITPGPFDPKRWHDRKLPVTEAYSEAVKSVAKQLGAGVVDTWAEFRGKDLGSLVTDGIHLTPAGYKLVFDALMRVIRRRYPEIAPENLPIALPNWEQLAGSETEGAHQVVIEYETKVPGEDDAKL